MLKDVAEKYYFDNFNCAESVFLAANEYYSLGMDTAVSKMVGGFGGGIQTGNACGALLAAVSVLSLLCIDVKAHESGTLRNAVSLFVTEFEEKMQTILTKEQFEAWTKHEQEMMERMMSGGGFGGPGGPGPR